jgi:hypothetical protein
MLAVMAQANSPLDSLWREYRDVFKNWDDLTLARWLSQTLGQFEGHVWRMSHPLLGAYRLAAQLAHDRQIWFKRLATPPIAYTESPCCRAPILPLLTRDVAETGLICPHCDERLVEAVDLPGECSRLLLDWAGEYSPVHAVAHWDDRQRKSSGDYERAFEEAAKAAEMLLVRAGTEVAPALLDHYPAIIWEDQDECLEVRPEDVKP